MGGRAGTAGVSAVSAAAAVAGVSSSQAVWKEASATLEPPEPNWTRVVIYWERMYCTVRRPYMDTVVRIRGKWSSVCVCVCGGGGVGGIPNLIPRPPVPMNDTVH